MPLPSTFSNPSRPRSAFLANGGRDLSQWLSDAIYNGLSSLPEQPQSFWDGIANRMVDADAPGVARLLRRLQPLTKSGEGWPDRVLDQLGRLHLLAESLLRYEDLPEALQSDLQAVLGGVPDSTPPILQVLDSWVVLGRYANNGGAFNDVPTVRMWLYGKYSRRFACQSVTGPLPTGRPLSPDEGPDHPFAIRGNFAAAFGLWADAELTFGPSAYPLRAVVRQVCEGPYNMATPSELQIGYVSISAALEGYAEALSANPFLEQFPVALQNVIPTKQGNTYLLCDDFTEALPIWPGFANVWSLFALSGGEPISVFGEWEGQFFLPLSVWHKEAFIAV